MKKMGNDVTLITNDSPGALDQSDERKFYEREILELMKKEILCPTENSIISSQLFQIFIFCIF